MGKIVDLPMAEKPREKAERFGIDTLKDEELLALIINTGTVGQSSLDIARSLLEDCHYLADLLNKPVAYFYGFKGLKKAKAIKLTAALEIARRINEKQRLIYEENSEVSSESLYQRYSFTLSRLQQEVLVLVILNKNKQIIYEKILYKGDDNNIVLNTREILRLLMIHNGYHFYLIHNHPNTSFSPSHADITFTNRLKTKAKAININFVDHLIIFPGGYYSFLYQSVFLKQENNEFIKKSC